MLAPYLRHPGFEMWSGVVEGLFEGYFDNPEVLVIDGDVTVDGDLDAAWISTLERDVHQGILVIDGDLKVSRDIVVEHDPLAYPNRESATVALIVRGNLVCRSLFAGGVCSIAVAGTAVVSEVVLIHDDHASFVFARLSVPILSVDQWNLDGNFDEVGVIECSGCVGPGASWPELEQEPEDFFLPELIGESGVLDVYDVAQRLRAGRPVFWPHVMPRMSAKLEPSSARPTSESWEGVYRKKLVSDPEDARARGELIELLLESGDIDKVRELIETAPDRVWGRSDGKIERGWLEVRGRDAVVLVENPSATRFAEAMERAHSEDWEDALGCLFQILETDRAFGDDLARVAMVRIFEVIGPRSQRTNAWRAKMSAVLYA